jgi:hypothetical protein
MKDVYANGHEIASQSGGGKVTASFPDVCLSPPAPPAGPLPVPYPNSSFSKDMKNGSTSVKIGGKPVMLRDQSFYATSPLGDEAATRNFGAGIITHTITGKTFFVCWSMDVLFEGMNVPRHIDLTTFNHGSNANNAVPLPNLSKSATGNGGQVTFEVCPCCKGPLHDNQKDPSGTPYKTLPEMEFYQRIANYRMQRRAEMQQILRRVDAGEIPMPDFALKPDKKSDLSVKDNIIRMGDECERDLAKLQSLRAKNPHCPNVHTPPDEGCGVHFQVMHPGRAGEARDRQFTKGVRRQSISEWRSKGWTIEDNDKVNHKTPLDAGGCPLSMTNLIPTAPLQGDCKEIEDAQSRLQNLIANTDKDRSVMYR